VPNISAPAWKAGVGYSGAIVFDSTKPDRTPRKSLEFEASMHLADRVR